MLKLLDPMSMSPPNLRSAIERSEDGLKDMESLQAVNRAVEGLPCSLMPDGRSATSNAKRSVIIVMWMLRIGRIVPVINDIMTS